MGHRRPPRGSQPLHGPADLLLLRRRHRHLPRRPSLHRHDRADDHARFLRHPPGALRAVPRHEYPARRARGGQHSQLGPRLSLRERRPVRPPWERRRPRRHLPEMPTGTSALPASPASAKSSAPSASPASASSIPPAAREISSSSPTKSCGPSMPRSTACAATSGAPPTSQSPIFEASSCATSPARSPASPSSSPSINATCSIAAKNSPCSSSSRSRPPTGSRVATPSASAGSASARRRARR